MGVSHSFYLDSTTWGSPYWVWQIDINSNAPNFNWYKCATFELLENWPIVCDYQLGRVGNNAYLFNALASYVYGFFDRKLSASFPDHSLLIPSVLNGTFSDPSTINCIIFAGTGMVIKVTGGMLSPQNGDGSSPWQQAPMFCVKAPSSVVAQYEYDNPGYTFTHCVLTLDPPGAGLRTRRMNCVNWPNGPLVYSGGLKPDANRYEIVFSQFASRLGKRIGSITGQEALISLPNGKTCITGLNAFGQFSYIADGETSMTVSRKIQQSGAASPTPPAPDPYPVTYLLKNGTYSTPAGAWVSYSASYASGYWTFDGTATSPVPSDAIYARYASTAGGSSGMPRLVWNDRPMYCLDDGSIVPACCPVIR